MICLYLFSGFSYSICIYISDHMSLADKLKKGTKVKITAKGELQGKFGLVKYVGPIEGKEQDGDFIGLQLSQAIGKNNGAYEGVEYFKTKPNFGAFLKPTALVLVNGTPVSSLAVGGTGSKIVKTSAIGASKLSKDLEVAAIEQTSQLKKQLTEANEKIKQLQGSNWKQEADQLKLKLKEVEQSNRILKMESQKVKYAVKEKDEGREKELSDQIQFFKSQKEAIEKEKADLKKKNAQLNAQLEEYVQSVQMVETLTQKIEALEAKNQKLKQQLQSANGELKNYKMVGGDEKINQGELQENLKVLNETVAFLESDLEQANNKFNQLKIEFDKLASSSGDLKKLERKIKQKDEEIQQMSLQLESYSDAATFAEKLTLDMLKKDQELKQTTLKLNFYLNRVQELQNELALSKDFSDELNVQLLNQEQLMDKFSKQMEEKNRHIQELNRQIEKYKKKIMDLAQNSESQASNLSNILDEKEEEVMPKSYLGFDQYQTKYYNALKVNQSIRESLLHNQIQFSGIRNQVGVYMLNLNEALPESFTSKFYPQVVATVTSIKSANDKLYYIFQTITNTFKYKPEIYSKENQDLSQWLILLMKESIMLYGSLHKLELSLTTAESEEQLSEVLAHRILKDQVRKIDTFALELLNRFADDNISASIDFQPFASPIESLDEINIDLKRNFSKQYDMKMRLCIEAMETITATYQMVINFKHTNELGENAEVDNLLQNLIKTILQYLHECCMNPYIRYKAEMKQYLEGLSLINSIFSDIRLEGNYKELSSLYSETQNIAMLRDTILTTQFHVKELLNDLQDIIYPSELSKLQTQLPGKVWVERLRLIKDQLLRAKQLSEQKAELQQLLTQTKKKVLVLERDLKDKQSTKQLYEKRIGELQIKLEQAGPLQNENKRQGDKIKALEQANKIIEDEITDQSKKRKHAEQELKNLKERFDLLQTETMMRNKRQKVHQAISSEDVASLAIFKNSIKESNTLRTLDLKKKVLQLRQSPIFSLHETKGLNQQGENNCSVVRRKAVDQMSKFQISNPFESKRPENLVVIDKILKEMDGLSFKKINVGGKNGDVLVGKIYLPVNVCSESRLQMGQKSLRAS